MSIQWEELADNVNVVYAAYFAALLPWSLLYLHDFISEQWKSIRRIRRAGYRHIVIVSLPLPYVMFYVLLQYRAGDYKEMSAAATSVAFSIWHISQTCWGLSQVSSFSQWAVRARSTLHALGLDDEDIVGESNSIERIAINSAIVDNEVFGSSSAYTARSCALRLRGRWSGGLRRFFHQMSSRRLPPARTHPLKEFARDIWLGAALVIFGIGEDRWLSETPQLRAYRGNSSVRPIRESADELPRLSADSIAMSDEEEGQTNISLHAAVASPASCVKEGDDGWRGHDVPYWLDPFRVGGPFHAQNVTVEDIDAIEREPVDAARPFLKLRSTALGERLPAPFETSGLLGFSLYPRYPESTLARWCVALFSQAGVRFLKAWPRGASVCSEKPQSGSARRSEFSKDVWATAVLQLTRSEATAECGMASYMPLAEWFRFKGDIERAVFDKGLFFESGLEHGAGLPYGSPNPLRYPQALFGFSAILQNGALARDLLKYDVPWHMDYSRAIKDSLSIIPPELEKHVVDHIDTAMLEWLVILMSVRDWGGTAFLSSPFPEASVDEIQMQRAVRRLKRQLQIPQDDSLHPMDCSFPLFARPNQSSERGVQGQRNTGARTLAVPSFGPLLWDLPILQVSLHIDNWVALSNGEHLEKLDKLPFAGADVQSSSSQAAPQLFRTQTAQSHANGHPKQTQASCSAEALAVSLETKDPGASAPRSSSTMPPIDQQVSTRQCYNLGACLWPSSLERNVEECQCCGASVLVPRPRVERASRYSKRAVIDWLCKEFELSERVVEPALRGVRVCRPAGRTQNDSFIERFIEAHGCGPESDRSRRLRRFHFLLEQRKAKPINLKDSARDYSAIRFLGCNMKGLVQQVPGLAHSKFGPNICVSPDLPTSSFCFRLSSELQHALTASSITRRLQHSAVKLRILYESQCALHNEIDFLARTPGAEQQVVTMMQCVLSFPSLSTRVAKGSMVRHRSTAEELKSGAFGEGHIRFVPVWAPQPISVRVDLFQDKQSPTNSYYCAVLTLVPESGMVSCASFLWHDWLGAHDARLQGISQWQAARQRSSEDSAESSVVDRASEGPGPMPWQLPSRACEDEERSVD